jgi:hypothetical protein
LLKNSKGEQANCAKSDWRIILIIGFKSDYGQMKKIDFKSLCIANSGICGQRLHRISKIVHKIVRKIIWTTFLRSASIDIKDFSNCLNFETLTKI